MSIQYNNWRVCDICGSEGMCRPASEKEIALYDAEDVCQRCDSEEIKDWTHVDQELPEDVGTFLCVVKGVRFTDIRILDFTNGGYKWYDPQTYSPVDNVTHWMFLPSMPK